jgi:hypothetical protein
MPKLLKNNKYEHTPAEDKVLKARGFDSVVSSNVSAIGAEKGILYVRFHGGATYGYPNSGELYKPMLATGSKGKFVWNELRRKNVPYFKTGKSTLQRDVPSTDMMVMEDNTNDVPSGLLLGTLLGTMVSNKDILMSGIIASLIFAETINAETQTN